MLSSLRQKTIEKQSSKELLAINALELKFEDDLETSAFF